MLFHRSCLTALLLLLFSEWRTSSAENPKCPKMSECPFRSFPCTADTDCPSEQACCPSTCGQVCMKPLYTGCEQLQRAARRRAKSLGPEGKSVRVPRCMQNGAFEPIQCDNEINSSCWCVDDTGFELPGTRAPAAALVNCTAPKPCAAHTCRMFCPLGFALAPDGCPLCRCRDPCEEIRCPDSLSCQLEEVACSDPPCPPIPACKRGRSLENICPVGEPLRISQTVRPFLCGNEPSKPACPPMFRCLVQSGNDYGVCCPASLDLQKAGQCPTDAQNGDVCGTPCDHDLECTSVKKCCNSPKCGKHCAHPQNVTDCIHQRMMTELLTVSERAGRGYVPQCSSDGQFEPKQCSRNGFVCWCVDKAGSKIPKSMGASANVTCTETAVRERNSGRSLTTNKLCEKLECAAICEYGFKLDSDGCQTCNCDDPCEGYACGPEEECVNAKDADCTDFFCPSLPVCRPKAMYSNPCEVGTPMTDEVSGSVILCDAYSSNKRKCPSSHQCTQSSGSLDAVCCPAIPSTEKATKTEPVTESTEKQQTMCEYLRDFSESMEGTTDEMSLALPPPKCHSDGSYAEMQCRNSDCWCVDSFGTEIPRTRSANASIESCMEIRDGLDCLDLTCRMACDYGFELSNETQCPTCQCRDPCSQITCSDSQQCQLVEVSCKDKYCPPVPACLPRKMGQCPYLVPTSSTSCDFQCNSDLTCNGTSRCCSNGCGTQCTEPLLMTACQHRRAVAQHQATESGIPAGKLYIPSCRDDGAYEPLQCNPVTRECWCVDFKGFEVSGTRTPLSLKLTCSPPPESPICPKLKCSSDCEHGFEMDDYGCRTCSCLDPCAGVTCRGEGETCRLVQVECVAWPCPPVPMCLPQKENPCQVGEPLVFAGEAVSCGPDLDVCPTSHKCQLSPLGEYAVCCPKPRDVCFEPKDSGICDEFSASRNLTRWFFNPRSNQCETFSYTGCHGNHNNFHTVDICDKVCPVLSQCERLREKNQRVAERYQKPTFIPRCETEGGSWKAIQCLDHVGVCWCVSPTGEPLKGTLTRNGEPECNFRQARGRTRPKYDDIEIVLEQLMMQIDAYEEGPLDQEAEENSIVDTERPLKSRCEALKAQCDENGKFIPMQCEDDMCWCVDEAGNQLPHTSTFPMGQQSCTSNPIESVDVTLGFRGDFNKKTATKVADQIAVIVSRLKGVIQNDDINTDVTPDGIYLNFVLIGPHKVDVAYKLEDMVTNQFLPGLVADITRSQFAHRVGQPQQPIVAEQVVALEHREIVSQSPVSMIAPYHTALIVLAAASAFVISVLTLLVILYRRKMSSIDESADLKQNASNDRFLIYNKPIYVELPKERFTNILVDQKLSTMEKK